MVCRLVIVVLAVTGVFVACQVTTADVNITADRNDTKVFLEDKFLYFAYGSNLLAKRIHINNPTAVRISKAKLADYRLDFGYWSRRWKGAAATVVPDQGKHVWGAVWQMDKSDMDNLDRQEGVSSDIYFPFEVEVEKPDGKKLLCRCYQLCNTPTELKPGQPIPEDRLPSELYLSVIIQGARETGLPNEYIEQLEKISHNSYKGDNSTILSSLVSSS
ncbi:gamma-glutamylcyclotransferase-like isoform X1 [Schistocerca cancellata]|uniref:gamma-glutamylcyclotransferase-like isoform X1 n=1 Tax=Schistocerca cancellata TaxID=274614 RepID=UPI0021182FAB|nr:gamma-glutamylcyclotransferase-like isoform X1 [Schistocerca cancellata]